MSNEVELGCRLQITIKTMIGLKSLWMQPISFEENTLNNNPMSTVNQAISKSANRYRRQSSATFPSNEKVNEARWFNLPRCDDNPAGNINNGNRNNPGLRLAFRPVVAAIIVQYLKIHHSFLKTAVISNIIC